MAKMLVLRWTPITTNSGIWFDSNLVILNGTSGVHIEMKGNGNDVTAFQSMTGNKFVTCFQDYFGDIWDKIIPHPGIGQVIKFRVNRLPDPHAPGALRDAESLRAPAYRPSGARAAVPVNAAPYASHRQIEQIDRA